ncbi:MAG TPA: hypothetical protein VEA69_16410 [Tepidisphaeraceae bacterium]|nr:hypothetical protein [Tepidisphaeraceae bacterium]
MGHATPTTVVRGDAGPLEYAPSRAGRRRVRRAVRYGLLALLLAGVGCAVYWRAPIAAYARLHWAQRQCMAYAAPADREVCRAWGENGAAPPVAAGPDCWTAYAAIAGVAPGRPGRWTATGAAPIAFLHGRTSKGGRERLVVVRCTPMYLASAFVTQGMHATVIEPAAMWPVGATPKVHAGKFSGGYPVHRDVRVTAGQVDPNDDARFTIAYTIDGRPGTVVGVLNDDETVTLTVAAGSATMFEALRKQ